MDRGLPWCGECGCSQVWRDRHGSRDQSVGNRRAQTNAKEASLLTARPVVHAKILRDLFKLLAGIVVDPRTMSVAGYGRYRWLVKNSWA